MDVTHAPVPILPERNALGDLRECPRRLRSSHAALEPVGTRPRGARPRRAGTRALDPNRLLTTFGLWGLLARLHRVRPAHDRAARAHRAHLRAGRRRGG